MQCRAVRLPVLDFTPTRAVAADGTFGGTQRYTIRYKGFSGAYSVTFRGRFLADGATGTFNVTMRQRDSKGRYAPCRSGQQTWAARA